MIFMKLWRRKVGPELLRLVPAKGGALHDEIGAGRGHEQVQSGKKRTAPE
jgi:hypothetical protein